MDLTAELDELSHGLHRQRRLIELTVNRVHLATLLLEKRNELPAAVSLADFRRVQEHLHHEELFRAVLVAGISAALGTSPDSDLLELIANAPRTAGACLADRRDRLVRAIEGADALSERLHVNAVEPVDARLLRIAVRHGQGNVIELEPRLETNDLAETVRHIVQPSLRDFVHPAA